MVLLFTAIFATITLIEDRREGFLQAVLAGPGARFAVVLGKCLGATAVALVQAGLFLAFAPLAKVSAAQVDLPFLGLVMVLASLSLTGLGFCLAWALNSSTGYHAVMSVVLIPLWVLSGAMFPLEGAGPFISAIMRVNPMRFAVDGVRRGLYGDAVAQAVSPLAPATGQAELLWLFGLAVVTVGVATLQVSRRE
jgi:ABC-2 type transport system permease protein